MNEMERYIRDVMHNIHAPARDRERIEADLRAHFQAALDAGESPEAVIARMGDPVQVAAEFMAETPLRYAGFWWRIAAFGLDLAIVSVVLIVFGFLAVAFGSHIPPHPATVWDWVAGAAILLLCIGAILGFIATVVLYFPILEARFGQTIGKRVLGLRVLKENGLPIGYKEAFIRRISFYGEFLPLDGLFIPFTSRRQRAFDMVARTVVIREPDASRSRALLVATLIIAVPLVCLLAAFQLSAKSPQGSRPSGHITSTYESFTGVERGEIQVNSGQAIVLDYQAALTAGGITIKVENPRGETIWQMAVPAGEQASPRNAEIRVHDSGRYTIVVEGSQAGGNLNVSWQRR